MLRGADPSEPAGPRTDVDHGRASPPAGNRAERDEQPKKNRRARRVREFDGRWGGFHDRWLTSIRPDSTWKPVGARPGRVTTRPRLLGPGLQGQGKTYDEGYPRPVTIDLSRSRRFLTLRAFGPPGRRPTRSRKCSLPSVGCTDPGGNRHTGKMESFAVKSNHTTPVRAFQRHWFTLLLEPTGGTRGSLWPRSGGFIQVSLYLAR